jgi:hypothetical protein
VRGGRGTAADPAAGPALRQVTGAACRARLTAPDASGPGLAGSRAGVSGGAALVQRRRHRREPRASRQERRRGI